MPTASFTWVSGGVNVDFTNTSGGGGISWSWDFGDGFSSSLQNPSYVYGTIGSYNVTLIVTNSNGCSDTIVQVVDVTVGIGEIDLSTITMVVFPNPFSDYTRIEFSNPKLSSALLVLYDVRGAQALKMETNTDVFVIRKGQLAPGAYLIELRLDDLIGRHKLLVE